jgi:hypothetical protein
LVVDAVDGGGVDVTMGSCEGSGGQDGEDGCDKHFVFPESVTKRVLSITGRVREEDESGRRVYM